MIICSERQGQLASWPFQQANHNAAKATQRAETHRLSARYALDSSRAVGRYADQSFGATQRRFEALGGVLDPFAALWVSPA
jgi:hypothetical protein